MLFSVNVSAFDLAFAIVPPMTDPNTHAIISILAIILGKYMQQYLCMEYVCVHYICM